MENDNLVNEQSEFDNFWISNKKGFQIADLKYPNFDDVNMDNQLRLDITYENLIEDIYSSIELLIHLEKTVNTLFVSENSNLIFLFFNKHQLNQNNYLLYSYLLRRKISLIFYMLKRRNEIKNEFIESTINQDYVSISSENIINHFNNIYQNFNLKKDEELQANFFEIVKDHLNHEKIIYLSQNIPSITGISICLKFLKTIAEKTLKYCYSLIREYNEEVMIDFTLNLCKLQNIYSVIHFSYQMDNNDIFNIPESDKIWEKLKNYVDRIILFSRINVEKKMKNVCDQVILASAAVSRGYKYSDKFLRALGMGWFFTYYFFNQKKANLQCKKFFIHPQAEVARQVWNIVDTNPISFFNKIILPPIGFRRKLYLKRTDPEINIERIIHYLEMFKNGQTTQNNFSPYTEDRQYIGERLLEHVTKENDHCYVKVKLLYSKTLRSNSLKTKFNPLKCICIPKRNFTRNSLIVHIHGGGFISMSSDSHENYLRKWVNELQIPLISIDYGLAPEHPYPKALDDCWQAYKWIINYAEKELEITIEKIILTGDSAGGNLALGVTFLSIINNVRIPDALFLFYPALKFHFDYFTPSLLMSVNDVILTYHFLRFCVDAYIQNYFNKDDFFLSPINAPIEIIKKLPYIRIIAGSSDPLRDDILRFTKILTYNLINIRDNNVNCRYIEFKYFPHGFLNYDSPFMMPEVAEINNYVCMEMDKFVMRG